MMVATLELACNFDETGNTVLDVSGLNRSWSIAGSGNGVTRAIDGNTRKVLQNIGPDAVFPPNVGQTATRTIMCSLKGALSTAGWPVQWYKASEDTGLWGILILSGQVHIQARNASGVARASFAAPSDWSTVWHHIAGSYDGTNIKLYIDGDLKATTPITEPLRTDGVLQLFGYSETDYIDDLRIFDGALTDAQVAMYKNIPVGAEASSGFLTQM
jgi:hypothetical protein